MAEAAQAPPTFKLVLVGDGGTGKVRRRESVQLQAIELSLPCVASLRNGSYGKG